MIHKVFSKHEITIKELKCEPALEEEDLISIKITGKARESLDTNALLTELSSLEKVEEICN